MTRKKSNNFINVFKIFFSSIYLYFIYLDQTMKSLLFPVLGQVFSTILIFTLTYFFTINYNNLSARQTERKNKTSIII